jgi:micrococcal nuclease
MTQARTALIIFVVVLIGCGDSEQTERDLTGGETGRVTRVIDGDTIELEGVGRVRLIGVDTPERGEECFEEATAYLRDRIDGQTVQYRYQSERKDRYGRALLDLFQDGQLVNLDIAQAGWGEALIIQPNDRYAAAIIGAEAEARAASRGRWPGCFEDP